MKNIIIWGTGKYYDYKVSYISKKEYNIIGVISKNVAISDYPIVDKNRIDEYDYDKLIIMSERYMFEILNEALGLGIKPEKIILGVNLTPATESECQYISADVQLELNSDGKIVWNHNTIISSMKDIEEIKKINRGNLSEKQIKSMPMKPLSYNYGISRGGYSIARYYIDKFVDENKQYISGVVMEIGDNRYTKKGEEKVKDSWIMVLDDVDGENYMTGNLETGEGIEEELIDCFILTNVLSCLFDIQNAVEYIGKSLKKGGHAIITVPGIAGVCRMDSETYGQYWRFTPSGLERLFKKHISNVKITIKTYGNVKTSAAFLYGMTVEDLTQEELDYRDSNYPMVIGALVEKC